MWNKIPSEVSCRYFVIDNNVVIFMNILISVNGHRITGTRCPEPKGGVH